MLAWLKGILTRSKPVRASRLRFVPWVRGRYDAAVTNDANRRHWAGADGLSADAAASPEVRRTLRNRARYEVANNSCARGIVLTLANDCVGTGPRLQMLSADAAANGRIEREFSRWAVAVGLAEMLRTIRMARAQDGEAFCELTDNPELNSPVKLDLQLVEADQVTTPDALRPDDNQVDGIVFDSFGNPAEYHVLKAHPGDVRSLSASDYDRVPAASMVHLFRTDRPGQRRGVPEITPALPLRHSAVQRPGRGRLPGKTESASRPRAKNALDALSTRG